MEYKAVNGKVYSRYAMMPPVINSDLAYKYGIRVPSVLEPSQYSQLETGKDVKLRLIVNDGKIKLTCHGKIDWVGTSKIDGNTYVHIGNLSLSTEEFKVLADYFSDRAELPIEFGVRLRDYGKNAESINFSQDSKEIMRMIAVSFPLKMFDAIDEIRGDVPFSEFVVNTLKKSIKL